MAEAPLRNRTKAGLFATIGVDGVETLRDKVAAAALDDLPKAAKRDVRSSKQPVTIETELTYGIQK